VCVQRRNLLAGKSGISQIERWDPVKHELPTTIAGEIKGASLNPASEAHSPLADLLSLSVSHRFRPHRLDGTQDVAPR
jgi:3-oxoacyl-(acyl-carrier-protein) synthase